MDEPGTRRERERDLDRVLTFVDAVVAIAITLLVLPLAELGGELDNEPVVDLMRDERSALFGFFLSFLVIAQLWLAQQRAVSTLVALDPLAVKLLLLWTLTIVLLPFATVLVTDAGDQPATKIVYIGIMALSSAILTVIAWWLGRDRSIRDRDEKPDPAPSMAVTLAFLLALAISLAMPSTQYFSLLLLFAANPVAVWWRRRRKAAPTGSG